MEAIFWHFIWPPLFLIAFWLLTRPWGRQRLDRVKPIIHPHDVARLLADLKVYEFIATLREEMILHNEKCESEDRINMDAVHDAILVALRRVNAAKGQPNQPEKKENT